MSPTGQTATKFKKNRGREAFDRPSKISLNNINRHASVCRSESHTDRSSCASGGTILSRGSEDSRNFAWMSAPCSFGRQKGQLMSTRLMAKRGGELAVKFLEDISRRVWQRSCWLVAGNSLSSSTTIREVFCVGFRISLYKRYSFKVRIPTVWHRIT